jgi:predicted DNA-binding transcriptional regulator AlpA
MSPSTPERYKYHHLDRRADQIASDGGEDDELLSTIKLASWLGVSTQWVEIGRSKKYGPEFVRLGPRHIVYRRSDVIKWLRARTFASTSDYGRAPVEAA